MKIFWCWQSDTPGKTGRHLVRDALSEAIKLLKEDVEIDEPTRDEIHLDSDMRGTPGSRGIVETILKKIDAATVVVADTTLVGDTYAQPSGSEGQRPSKRLINSNVAIELGYALRTVTEDNVLMVINVHYGSHEDLPFDLRHRGGSIVFDLPPDAERNLIRQEKRKLVDQFVKKLKLVIPKTTVPSAAFIETSATFSKAAYFSHGEALVELGGGIRPELQLSYASDTLCYLRLIPHSRLRNPLQFTFLGEKCDQWARQGRSLGFAPANLTARNKYGVICYDPGPVGKDDTIGELQNSTQLFQSGEIWSITSSLIKMHDEFGRHDASHRFVGGLAFERFYYDALHSTVEFAVGSLDIAPPFDVELGLMNIEGLEFGYADSLGFPDSKGPVRIPKVVSRWTLRDTSVAGMNALLLEFFRLAYDAAGWVRPEKLNGFPDGRPQAK